MSEDKKDSLHRKTNLKNKKEAKKALTKSKNITKNKTTTIKNKQSTYNKKTNGSNKKQLKTIEDNIHKIETNKKAAKTKKEPLSKTTEKTLTKTVKTKKEIKPVLKSDDKKETKKLTKASPTGQKSVKEIEKKITTTLKNKIFEEVKENEIIDNKKEKKLSNNKIVVASIASLLLIIIIGMVFVKYGNRIKKSSNNYQEYSIGEEITLKDNSIWYVIEYSGKSKDIVKLIKKTQIDINGDGKFDEKDKKKYSSTGKNEYDPTDKDSIAYYLENDYKEYLTENVGKIQEISLITSKEFVKVRSKMGYGYEWSEGNWLANNSLDSWWINASQNKKVYAVSKKGSYKLCNPSSVNYVRPVIAIEKEYIVVKD